MSDSVWSGLELSGAERTSPAKENRTKWWLNMVEDEGLQGNIKSPEVVSATDAIPHDDEAWMRMVTFRRGS